MHEQAARSTATLLGGGLVAFQIGLAAGLPWGKLAWGGGHQGVLPERLRVASGVSAAVWAGSVVLARREPPPVRWLTGFAALCGVGTLTNLASPSLPERMAWTPVSAMLAVSFWRLSRSGRGREAAA